MVVRKIVFLFIIFFLFNCLRSQSNSVGLFKKLCKKETIDLKKVLTFGDQGTGEEILYRPVSLCVDAGSNILIMDSEVGKIKKFDQKGRFVKSFSNKGRGPGEFLFGTFITQLPGGQIVGHDARGRRIILFSESGIYITSFPLRGVVYGLRSMSDSLIVCGVSRLVRSNMNSFQSNSPVRMSTKHCLEIINVYSHKRYRIDSLIVVNRLCINNNSKMGSMILPFTPTLLFGLLPSGELVSVHPDIQKAWIIEPKGDVVTTFDLHIPQLEVTVQEKKEVFSGRAFKQLPAPRLEKKFPFPKTKPSCTALYTDDHSNILQRGYEVEDGLYEYYAYSPEGEKMGRIEMPFLSKRAKFKEGYIYDIVRPEEDYPYVAKYSVE